MDRNTERIVNQAQTLTQAFPLATSGDTVLISIYDLTDNAQDVSLAAMTYEVGVAWSYAWTPTQNNFYLIDYFNQTQDVHHYEYVKVVGSSLSSPGVSGSGSTLTTLIQEFLIQIDQYNATDAADTAVGTSYDLAKKSINKGLQKIYSMVKDSKFMQAYPSTSLASVSGTDYIELSGITDMDEIMNLVDTTYLYTLTKIPFWKYREWAPDPSSITGIPTHYARLFNRIYLYPRPSAAITYTTDFVKVYGDLSSGADQALLPAKYNYWIYSEAEVEWYKMQDPNAVPQIVLNERKEAREIGLADIFSGFNENYVSESIWGREQTRRRSLYTID